MCTLRLIGRILLLLLVFLGVGFWAAHALIAHAVANGTPEYKVRLAGAMGGLFAGGTAAVLAFLCMIFSGRKPTAEKRMRTGS